MIAPATGHICTHEAGAIEATGHKVLELPQREGKLSAAELRTYLEGFYGDENHEHMVFPGMVYLSWPTELGTLYTRAELGEIHKVCRQYKIPLYLDGARMGYGLASRGSGMTLADLAAKLRRVLHRGDQGGGPVRRGGGLPPAQRPRALYDRREAAGRPAGQGLAAGGAVRRPVHRWTLPEAGQKCHRDGGAAGERDSGKRGSPSIWTPPPTRYSWWWTGPSGRTWPGRPHSASREQLDEERTVIRFVTSWATRMEDVEELIRRL